MTNFRRRTPLFVTLSDWRSRVLSFVTKMYLIRRKGGGKTREIGAGDIRYFSMATRIIAILLLFSRAGPFAFDRAGWGVFGWKVSVYCVVLLWRGISIGFVNSGVAKCICYCECKGIDKFKVLLENSNIRHCEVRNIQKKFDALT